MSGQKQFLATDPDLYEHFMGRWSVGLATPSWISRLFLRDSGYLMLGAGRALSRLLWQGGLRSSRMRQSRGLLGAPLQNGWQSVTTYAGANRERKPTASRSLLGGWKEAKWNIPRR
jgi:hypothetical protein